MKYLYRYKYKIYRRFQSDIWGDIILGQKFDNLQKFILKNFEYNLKKFYRIRFKGVLRHLLNRRRNFRLRNSYTNYFMDELERNLYFSKKDYLKKKLLNYTHKLFWLNFFNVYSEVNLLIFKKIDYYKLFNSFFFKTKQKIGLRTILFLARLSRRIKYQNWHKAKVYSRFSNRGKFFFKKPIDPNRMPYFNKYNIYHHIRADYMYPPRKFFYKKRRSLWWRLKIEQNRSNVFFGFFNRKKFLRFQQAYFFSSKLRLNWILKLVGRLSFILFSMNFFVNMYHVYHFIKKNGVLVNNKKKFNPNFSVSLFDNISFERSNFKKLYLLFKFRLKNNNFIINYPKYLEVNYRILTATIWKIPKSSDILAPYDFPFKSFNYDWLLYKNYYY